MDQEILKKIESQAEKIDAIYRTVEKMRKYFLWTLIITLALIILPFIGLIVVIPQFFNTYTNRLGL